MWHALLVPASSAHSLVLFGLIQLHLGLLQRVGSAGPATGRPEPYASFYPRQAMKDLLVSAAGAIALFSVATLVALEDSGPASPEAGSFVPKPEWYFYSHFELLKFLPADWQILGTFVLPNLLILLLLLLPFLDRSPERAFTRRKFMNTVGLLGLCEISVDNVDAVCDLSKTLPDHQRRLLSDNAVSIAQAHYYPN